MRTQFVFSGTKLENDGGYYLPEKRAAIQGRLRTANLYPAGMMGDREFFSTAVSGRQVKFFINYGPTSKAQDEAEIEAFLQSPEDAPFYIQNRLGEKTHAFLEKELIRGAKNRDIEIVLPLNLADGEEVFEKNVIAYGRICEAVGKALYHTDHLQEPNQTIVIGPPTEEQNIEMF